MPKDRLCAGNTCETQPVCPAHGLSVVNGQTIFAAMVTHDFIRLVPMGKERVNGTGRFLQC